MNKSRMRYKIRGPRLTRVKTAKKLVLATEETTSAERIKPRDLFNACWQRGYSVKDIVAEIGGTVADWNNWMRDAAHLQIAPFINLLVKPKIRPARFHAKPDKKEQASQEDEKIKAERMEARDETYKAYERVKYLLTTPLDIDLRTVLTGAYQRLGKAIEDLEKYDKEKEDGVASHDNL